MPYYYYKDAKAGAPVSDYAVGGQKKETFVVQVKFQQNSSWQGTIVWTDQKKTQHFRSTLEMIKLMNEAVSSGMEDAVQKMSWE